MTELATNNEKRGLPSLQYYPELQSWHISQKPNERETQLQLWLTEEAWNQKQTIGTNNLLTTVKSDLEKLTEDPFGKRSVDPWLEKADKAEKAKQLRSINLLSNELQSLFPNSPIAIKGTGRTKLDDREREDLLAQFQ